MIAHLVGRTTAGDSVSLQATADGKLMIDTADLMAVLGDILVKVSNSQPREVAQSINWAIGAVPANTVVYSPVVDLGVVAHAPMAGLAIKIASTAAVTGEELEVLWSVNGINYYPTPVSEIGSSRSSLVIASNADRSLISRCLVIGRYLKVRFKASSGGSAADSYAYFSWTYTT